MISGRQMAAHDIDFENSERAALGGRERSLTMDKKAMGGFCSVRSVSKNSSKIWRDHKLRLLTGQNVTKQGYAETGLASALNLRPERNLRKEFRPPWRRASHGGVESNSDPLDSSNSRD